MHCRVHADALVSVRMHRLVRADASILPPGNFITDATVRPSHGRPNGHRPTVHPSVLYRLRDNHALTGKGVVHVSIQGTKPFLDNLEFQQAESLVGFYLFTFIASMLTMHNNLGIFYPYPIYIHLKQGCLIRRFRGQRRR
jgi:hypothetical protein